ncbi:phage portal protein [Cetobacterium somerae]|uniref:phage portal protein n=1 Tax=Cetobacterium somerae TaxID=188913 RepID=UPI002251AA8B|nr:phage portal protein [Cetobacterium somerae]MCX3068433.1 phage portal protein [Cetobacterium somerae]
MKIVDKIKNIIKIDRKKDGYFLKEIGEFLGLTGIDVENIEQSSDLSETIYFICLKHLSETMAKMPWEKRVLTEKKGKERVLDSKIDNLLNIRPNPYMTATTFWGTVELNKLHYGNSYIYIEADKNGFPRYLWLLPSDQMEIWIDNRGILGSLNAVWYVWTDQRNGKKYTFEMDEIIHLKTHISFDGLSGAPIKDILKTQISSGKNSIGFLNKLYKNNMFGSKVLVQYTGELNKAAEEKLAKKIESFAKAQGSGKFIPMPFGMQAQLLDMKLADAQFFENNRTSALQLAAAFGIKPNVINDYTKSSYSNSETQQVDFYVNTLQPLFKAYEQELTYKLLTPRELGEGYRLEINEKMLFKMDNKTQAEVYSKYLTNFAMTPNEVREDLNLPYIEGGDTLLGNGSTINLENIGTQYKKGGE